MPNRRLAALVLLLCGGVVGGLGFLAWQWWERRSTVEPPAVDLSQVYPQVASGIKAARRAVQENPHSADAWGRLGMILQAHQYAEPAMASYDRAAELDDEEFRWPYLLAVLQSAANPAAASANFRRSVERAPSVAVLRIRWAELLIDQGQWDEAETQLNHALKLNKFSGRAKLRLAQLYFRRGQYDQARALAEQAAQHAPNHRVCHELLAQLLQRENQTQSAAEQLAKARAAAIQNDAWSDPFLEAVRDQRLDPHWFAFKAKRLIEQGQVGEGIRQFELLVAEHPDELAFREHLAQALIFANQLDRATEALQEGVERHPDSAAMHRLLGSVAFLREQWSEAAVHYQRALNLKPDDAQALYDLGISHLKLGNLPEAARWLNEAVRRQEDMLEARLELAQVLHRLGQHEQAERELSRAEVLAPEDPRVKQLRKRW